LVGTGVKVQVTVGVGVKVWVIVGVGVSVGVWVTVLVGVRVGVWVTVVVGVGVRVGVGVLVTVGVGVGVGVEPQAPVTEMATELVVMVPYWVLNMSAWLGMVQVEGALPMVTQNWMVCVIAQERVPRFQTRGLGPLEGAGEAPT
jgi:hypothetical protein